MRTILSWAFMLLGGISAASADCTCPSKFHCCESNSCVPDGTKCETIKVEGLPNDVVVLQSQSSFACKEDVGVHSYFIQGIHTFSCGESPDVDSLIGKEIFKTKPTDNILFLLETGYLYSCEDGEPKKDKTPNPKGQTVWRCEPADKKKDATHHKEHDKDK